MKIFSVIFESKIFLTFLIAIMIYLILNLYSQIQNQIENDLGLQKKQNFSLIVFFGAFLLFVFLIKEFGLVSFWNIIPGVLTILSWKVFFLSKEKEYQNLRRKTFFDEDGNYLLKKGVETRFPL